ncbi:MAG: bifunctional transaldolase/phosoglucose isomerase [Anaerolineae bacterium]|nr:bifunctional transaldolase/phosoglucose isomerase [Anaerolineae bacterium]
MANPPVDVQAFGQSIWYDNIRRKLLSDGTFQKLIDEGGVVGVTSNPTIFQKAIGGSDDYDSTILANLDLEAYAIFEQLALEDIQQAADLFRPVYERTNGRDGYVSLEVSPLLANDTAGTVAEAKRLFASLARPNVMIKIPATSAGIPAIEEVIAAGVNVNVTLIFSVGNYIDVAEAYMRGLERRMKAGQSVKGIASVASFFLSRIDTMVDKVLENNVLAAQGRDLDRVALNNRLLGKAAIVNAKDAYRKFMQLFYGERFRDLREAGAWVQRPLWASTGTKNPNYLDTMYLDGLIGRDTVNTVPPDTLTAFADHGTVRESILDGMDDIDTTLAQLAEVGVDLNYITQRLQDDGVESFAQSFQSLMEQIEAKRQLLSLGAQGRSRVALGIYAEDVKAGLKAFDAEFGNGRIWNKDGSLWRDHAPVIAKIVNRLGWLDVQKTIDIERVKAFGASVKGAFSHAVLLGMGGSSLAPEVLSMTFGSADGHPQLLVLDSTHPDRVLHIERQIDLSKTLFIVASKSGSTIESSAFYQYFWEKTGGKGDQFIAITDPGSALGKEARDKGFRDLFENPEDIGGRYSALSYFGLVPAAILGLDIDRLWASAAEMIHASAPEVGSGQHPGAYLGVLMGVMAARGRDKVCIFTSPSIASFGAWVEQLVAESTGKEGKGIVPVVGTTVGHPHDYASDRLFIYLKVEGDPGNDEIDERVKALREAGHPRMTIFLKDTYALGGEFFRWEYATAVAGKLLGVNPFDEPNVTEAKDITKRLLNVYQENGSLPSPVPVAERGAVKLYADKHSVSILRELSSSHNFKGDDITELLAAHITGTGAGDYFAMLAYLNPSPELDEMLDALRRRIRHVTKRAVTVGYGPRYLHSTGQLHKGGANSGVFFLLTADYAEDIAIPGMPFSFGTLCAAQAAGDFEALDAHKCRAVRLHLGADVMEGLKALDAAIDFLEARRR